jgi:transposase
LRQTCKLNDIDPLVYLAEVLTRIVNVHLNNDMPGAKAFLPP